MPLRTASDRTETSRICSSVICPAPGISRSITNSGMVCGEEYHAVPLRPDAEEKSMSGAGAGRFMLAAAGVTTLALIFGTGGSAQQPTPPQTAPAPAAQPPGGPTPNPNAAAT